MNSKKKAADTNVKVCANCETIDPKLTCAKCKVTRYCSKACQKQHWRNGHKVACVTPEERRPQSTASRDIDGDSQKKHGAEEKGDGGGECPVCLDSLSGCAVCMLPCKHAFHQECVEQLRKHGVHQVCPLCRAALPPGAEKNFEDATRIRTRIYVAVLHQVGSDDKAWKSLTESQRANMAVAIDMYTNAANQGHAGAQRSLGIIYHNGKGVAQDLKKAFEWYHKAADQGNADAQYNLGFMYKHGNGVAQDPKKAFEWCRKSADQGDIKAQYCLGIIYRNGDGVSQDFKKAVQWYRKSADQGHASAQFNLGLMYEDGDGVFQDPKKAVQWYRKSADQGYASAQYNLGLMYEKGKGVAQDLKKAVQWYRKSADQGDASAQYNVGVMYKYGEGVAQDPQKAVQWFQKAADQGHAKAQFNLGSQER